MSALAVLDYLRTKQAKKEIAEAIHALWCGPSVGTEHNDDDLDTAVEFIRHFRIAIRGQP